MAVKKVIKYARIVNQQINPNNPKQEAWDLLKNAVGKTEKYGYSHFTKTTTTSKDKKGKKVTNTNYNQPYKVTAHDFGFELPKNALIRKVQVGVRMASSKDNTGSVYPAVGFYFKDGGKKVKQEDEANKTGWHKGVYWVFSDRKLSKTFHTEGYEIPIEEFKKGSYSINNINSTLNGVDLYFHGDYNNQTVCLMYVWMYIEYDIPNYTVTTYPVNSKSNPRDTRTGAKFNAIFDIRQTVSNVWDYTQTMRVDVPWGTEIVGTPYIDASGDIDSNITQINKQSYSISLKFNDKAKALLYVPVKDFTVDTQAINLTNVTYPKSNNPIPNKAYYYESSRFAVDGYDQTVIRHTTPVHKRHTVCFEVDTVAQSDNTQILHTISNDKAYTLLNIELNTALSDSRVVLENPVSDETDYTGGQGYTANFTVPQDEKIHLHYTVCLRPHVEGDNIFSVYSSDARRTFSKAYDVLPPYSYHIGSTENEVESLNEWHEKLNGERINFTNHRIASNLNTGAFILPCHVKDGDSVMIQSRPSMKLRKWEQIDYIGCVPIEHYHFDPKSTYKDKLIDSHYKNKRYMGKELASDEDIDLNIRLHPKQVTTIQGLIDMDKPIPINANHRIFEGDSLNHRGWAEIYGITATKTNEHWYKCNIDVKYLTHNLNTRFHIKRGDRTFNQTIPSLLAEVQSSGDRISSDNVEDDFFIVDTDGTYAYISDDSEWEDYLDYQGEPVKWIGNETIMIVEDEDGNLITLKGKKSDAEPYNEILEYLEEQGETVKDLVLNENIQVYEGYNVDDNLKNRFTLDEGQHISIKTREPLSSINQIGISWGSSKLSENQENAIKRIFRLIDVDTDDVVFEYEYCDFDFSDFIEYTDITDDTIESLLRCRVIGRVKNNADYETVIDDIIDLESDIETSEVTYIDEDNEEHHELKYFGSSVVFELSNNVLSFVDEGYNGKEVELANVKLEGKQYYLESYWENLNTGGENDDIIAYFDTTVQDTIQTSKYSDKYRSMYVSPFPISGKEILFTREAEEGVLYYLKENDEEFSYLIEPYFQYHNGVDLRASSDGNDYISIFSLNYGYKTVYLENGLVSFAINRLNGDAYLRKYDPVLKQYVSLFDFSFNKFDDVNINSISDDRIELQASDTTIIMYRGHPYVILKHPTEAINIDSKSYKVYGQSVDGEPHVYPAYIDLMNHDNLLPECVTKKLDDDCVNLTEHIIDLPSTTLKLSRANDDDILIGDDVVFNVTDENNNPFLDRVCYLVKYVEKNKDSGFDEIGCNSDGTFTFKPDSNGAYQMMAVYVGDEETSYSISNEIGFEVGKPVERQTPSVTPPTPPLTGDYKLTMDCPSTMYYRDGTKVTFTLTKGGVPVPRKTIEMIDFGITNTALTDEYGRVSFRNHRAKNKVGKWTLGAKFLDTGDTHKTTVYKQVTVKKATPEFIVKDEALFEGDSFGVKLRYKNSIGTSYNLAKRKVSISVDKKKYDRKTNSYGNEYVKIENKGTHKYVCVFNGDENYNKCKLSYRYYTKKK